MSQFWINLLLKELLTALDGFSANHQSHLVEPTATLKMAAENMQSAIIAGPKQTE